MEIYVLATAFIASFLIMFVAAISGGVGLFTRPILILLGVPVNIIIGSSKVAGAVGELPGVYLLYKHTKPKRWLTVFLAVGMFFGAAFAALFVVTLASDSLEKIIGALILIVAIIFVFNKSIGLKESPPKFKPFIRHSIGFIGTIIISFLNTITGGMGIVTGMFYVWLYGKSYISSSSLWRAASNIGSVVSAALFIYLGLVNLELCIVLAGGFMLGSYLGTKYGLKKGEKWVKYVIFVIAILAAIKLIFL